MSLEFVSGLLLVLAVLGALVYILKELLSGTKLNLPSVNLSDTLGRPVLRKNARILPRALH